MDCHRGLEWGSGQVLTQTGREELAEHGPSDDDQHQGCGRRRRVADQPSKTDPRLFADLRVAATDADRTCGDGDEINGPIEGFVRAMSGRLTGLADLRGEGMASVRRRVENL